MIFGRFSIFKLDVLNDDSPNGRTPSFFLGGSDHKINANDCTYKDMIAVPMETEQCIYF